MWRNLQRHEVIVSGGEVNWLIEVIAKSIHAAEVAVNNWYNDENCQHEKT